MASFIKEWEEGGFQTRNALAIPYGITKFTTGYDSHELSSSFSRDFNTHNLNDPTQHLYEFS